MKTWRLIERDMGGLKGDGREVAERVDFAKRRFMSTKGKCNFVEITEDELRSLFPEYKTGDRAMVLELRVKPVRVASPVDMDGRVGWAAPDKLSKIAVLGEEE